MKRLSMWAVTMAVFLAQASYALAFEHKGESDGDTKILNDPTSSATLLKTFNLTFHGGVFESDHHIQRIGVLSESHGPEKTFIQFRDRKADDDYSYSVVQHPIDFSGARVGFAKIENSSARTQPHGTHCSTRGTCTIDLNANRPSPQHVFALRGFLVRYLSGDHQVNRISVIEDGGVLALNLHGYNKDDSVSFEVEYAWLPPEAVSSTGESSGVSKNVDGREVTPGTRVLSGFDFDYTANENDMAAIFIIGNDQNGVLSVRYTDAGFNKTFRWRVKWTILR
jgi:hypothetical protein